MALYDLYIEDYGAPPDEAPVVFLAWLEATGQVRLGIAPEDLTGIDADLFAWMLFKLPTYQARKTERTITLLEQIANALASQKGSGMH